MVDRGFDPDVADPFRGLTAHVDGGDAPVDLRSARAGNQTSEQGSALRTRPWSWPAMRALFTAWAAIASSYRSDGPMGEPEDGTIDTRSAES
jgi:hypothetical protein